MIGTSKIFRNHQEREPQQVCTKHHNRTQPELVEVCLKRRYANDVSTTYSDGQLLCVTSLFPNNGNVQLSGQTMERELSAQQKYQQRSV